MRFKVKGLFGYYYFERNNNKLNMIPREYPCEVYPPEQDNTRIIFKKNDEDGIFDFDNYRPEISNHKITQEDIANFFLEMNKVVHEIDNAPEKFSRLCDLSFFSIIISPIIGTMLLVTLNIREIYMMIVTLLGIIFGVLGLKFGPSKFQLRYKLLFQKAVQIVEQNEEKYRKAGLKWFFPTSFPHWIELQKDFYEEGGTLKKFHYSVNAEESYSPDKCIVCLVRKRSVVYDPCRHVSCCHTCTEKILDDSGKCPYCRVDITGIEKIFLV